MVRHNRTHSASTNRTSRRSIHRRQPTLLRRKLNMELLEPRHVLSFSYVLTDLGALGEQETFENNLSNWGINDYGEVVGLHESLVAGPGGQPFGGGGQLWFDQNENGFWDEEYQENGELIKEKRAIGVSAGDMPGVRIMDINDRGQIVGAVFDEDLTERLTIWDREGNVTVNDGPVVGGALTINDRGDVLDPIHGQLIPSGGVPIDLGSKFDEDTEGSGGLISALDINDSGQLLVTASGTQGNHFFTWTPGQTPVDTGVQPLAVGTLNNRGQAALMALTGGSFTTLLYTPGEDLVDLGEFLTRPHINDHGQVVGTRTTTEIPYIWDQTAGLVDVNTLISRPGDVSITHVIEINNFGQIIAIGCEKTESATCGDPESERRGYVLSPRLGLDQWWATAGQADPLNVTWTVKIVDQQRDRNNPTMDEAPQATTFRAEVMAPWGMPNQVVVLSNGSAADEMPAAVNGAGVANLGDRTPGTYQLRINGLSTPMQAATVPVEFHIEATDRDQALRSLFVADHPETFQGLDYSVLIARGASANVTQLSGQRVTEISVTEPGFGYSSSAPNVQISGGGGSGATAQAVVVDGRVASIDITNSGAGYSTPPTVTIDSPAGASTTTLAGAQALIEAFVPVIHMPPQNTYPHPFSVEQTFGGVSTPYFELAGWCQGLPARGDRSRDSVAADANDPERPTLNLQRFNIATPPPGEDVPPIPNSPCAGPHDAGEPTIYASINTAQFAPNPGAPFQELAVNYHFHYPRSNWRQFGGNNEHEGDWEGITVFFRRDNATDPWEPNRVAFGQHVSVDTSLSAPNDYWYTDGGQLLPWSSPALQLHGGLRPLVFVSQGGHASYPTAGETLWPDGPTDIGRFTFRERHNGVVPLTNVDVEYLPRIGSILPDDAQWEWLVYPGRWGRTDIGIANDNGDDGPRGPVFIKRGVFGSLLGNVTSVGVGDRWLNPWQWSDAFSANAGQFTPLQNVERFANLNNWVTLGDAQIVSDVAGLNTVVQLSEGSDAAIQQVISLPADAIEVFLAFDSAITQPGDGDVLTVAIEGQTVWSRPTSAENVSALQPTEPIDVSAFMGQTVGLEIRLQSQGIANSVVWIDDVVVLTRDENAPPLAFGDEKTIALAAPVVIDVLANDFDFDDPLDPNSIEVVQPSAGSVGINSYGTLTFNPPPGSVGVFTFTYTVADALQARSAPATVRITIGDSPMLPGDFNRDAIVNHLDYDFWVANFGAMAGASLQADGNDDGTVNHADYTIWRDNLPQAAIGLPGDYDNNTAVDEADYQLWSNSFGATGTDLAADGNGNEVVDLADYAIWRDNLGASQQAFAEFAIGTRPSSPAFGPAKKHQPRLDYIHPRVPREPGIAAPYSSSSSTATQYDKDLLELLLAESLVAQRAREEESLNENEPGDYLDVGDESLAPLSKGGNLLEEIPWFASSFISP